MDDHVIELISSDEEDTNVAAKKYASKGKQYVLRVIAGGLHTSSNMMRFPSSSAPLCTQPQERAREQR